MVAAVP